MQEPSMMITPVKFIENVNESKNKTGEATYVGALQTRLASFRAFVFPFVFVWDELDRPDNHAKASMIFDNHYYYALTIYIMDFGQAAWRQIQSCISFRHKS